MGEATQKQSLAEERAREVVVCPELQEKRDGGGGQWSPRRWLDEKEKRERQSQVETETREASKCPERPEATQRQSLAEERAREVVVCPELQEKRDGGSGQWSPRRWLDEKEKRERQSQVETETREASKCPERPEATQKQSLAEE